MKENDLLSKLERVERNLIVYDNNSNNRLQELEVDVPLDKLKEIVVPKEGDDQLYLPYVLGESQIKKLNELMGNPLETDSKKNYYVLDCVGFYNW
jgi:hypothetical protein